MTSPATNERYEYLDLFHDAIFNMIPPDGKVIGSIGCGFATTEKAIVDGGREVHGVDVSEQAIEVAKSRLTSARLIDPAETHPFEPDSLDGLILADVIEHMPLAWERLAGFAEMVRPGGWVVISVPNMRYIEALATLVFKGEWPEEPLGIFDRTHLQVMTHKRLRRWCDASGLQLERWFACYHFNFARRNLCRALNIGSLGLLRDITMYQVQGRFRRV